MRAAQTLRMKLEDRKLGSIEGSLFVFEGLSDWPACVIPWLLSIIEHSNVRSDFDHTDLKIDFSCVHNNAEPF